MGTRATDGSAGDADYGAIGASYAGCRQPDPRIAAAIAFSVHQRRDPHAGLRTRPEYDGSLVLVVSEP